MTPAPVGREVGRAVLDIHTPFFVSYAHADANPGRPGGARSPDQLAEKFYNDLYEEVAPLIHVPRGSDRGFMDVVGLEPGVHWNDELQRALGCCQVLVGLLSVPYLNSEWCGKEWHAFSLREKKRVPGMDASPHQGCIIPVRWAPLPFDPPAVVGDEVIFTPQRGPDPDLPERYKQDGIFGLLRTGQLDSYDIVVWQLAKRIQRIYYSLRLSHREFKPDELQNVFRGSMP
jgi:hypothetical protein